MYTIFIIFCLIICLIIFVNSNFFKNPPKQGSKIDESLRPHKLTPEEEEAFYKTEAGKQFNEICKSMGFPDKSKNKK